MLRGLWLGFSTWRGPGNGWLHAKLVLVLGAVGYHHACLALLKRFEQLQNRRSERWFRVFGQDTGGQGMILGIGSSGPQVAEGWHGQRFARQLQQKYPFYGPAVIPADTYPGAEADTPTARPIRASIGC